ncbi:MAG: hypothetical protein AUJ75_03620 [Candidatus Omnitrophica bacterium CG1_02_49_10]|nr:MAG: hypothetical protein AUJ75_03620 [Candidatus Omnitrophica bacterium CG1_02_49_10]
MQIDGGTLKRSKDYSRTKYLDAFLRVAISISAIAAFILTGTSMALRDFAYRITGNTYLVVALYFSVCYIAHFLILLCVNFYDSFVVEHKYGLSNQTIFGWEKRELKKQAIIFPLMLIFCELMYALMRLDTNYWWLTMALIWIVFAVILGKFAPVVIMPLFYKQRGLDDAVLKDRLTKLVRRCGAHIKDIFIIDLSRDTKKANAGLAGMGKTRRILLSDTLLADFNHDEIEVVTAHELGHHRLMHIYKNLLLASAETILTLYLVSVIADGLIKYLQLDKIYDISSLPVIALTLTVLGIFTAPASNALLRHMELSADIYALKHTGLFDSFESLMNKLSGINLRDPSPGRIAEAFFYDHPPVSRRIAHSKTLRHIYGGETK